MTDSQTPDNQALAPNIKTGVLLLHGLTGMPSEMRPIEKHLTQQGCIVSCPMLAGHGGDHIELLATGWKDWLASAKAALDELLKQCDHVVVGGLSMGALLSLMLAVDEPRVSGIVLLSTTINYDGQTSSPFKIFLPFVDLIPWLGNNCYWTESPPYGLKDLRLQKQITKQVEAAARGESTTFGLFRTYAGSLRQMDHLVKQVKKQAKKLRCPALVVHALEDTITTTKNAETICNWMEANDKTLVLLGGCDHVLTLDLRRKDVAAHIARFVAKASWDYQKDTASSAVASRN
ncbi:MAG TPA: alpha/beta fold hydrolase [Drouetiella sp.]|jgi:carboxylesterase